MDFGKAGWLSSIIEEAVAAHPQVSPSVPAPVLPEGRSGRAQARAYLRQALRASGLLQGPSLEDGEATGEAERPAEMRLFLSLVRTLARMGLDIALLTGAPEGPRAEQLFLLFAVFSGELDVAEALDAKLLAKHEVPKRLHGKVENALARRALSLAGDPVYGLVLHTGALYADAQLFGRQAIAYFARGRFQRPETLRRIGFVARQKAILVEVLAGLAVADHKPSYASRRAILRQVEGLELPEAIEAELRGVVKKSFEHPLDVRALVAGVRSQDTRHFLLEQALLASLVDGQRSQGERSFIRELAEALGVPEAELHRRELETAGFYARNRSVVDVFTGSTPASLMGEDFILRMQAVLEKNFQAMMQEARETGDLALLLAKAARGQKLTADERRRMRAQLIDVAKVIPALAIFAAPGGLLLLLAVAKVLHINLLPSAFQSVSEPSSGPVPVEVGGDAARSPGEVSALALPRDEPALEPPSQNRRCG
ncbi:TerB family tellurite resistance protein [Stigmatella sp. ncwal1]|uniref:TerB family tellurite resistance protein n=1 Tax=Stigmatella ashevillensis TaxID=2995309 RepID=A0ABT5DLB8_9BACT|nr:TerB family tellurite resistance protein [Stigmatella ashevillena]MDC0713930.1 TerB family tellurite resistance protein [Stigmatella ashevillena]